MAPAAIVFAAAPVAPTPRLRARLSLLPSWFVIAADNGATSAMDFGYTPDLVVGDLDSLDPATLERLRQANAPIDVHPRDKDATDGQLAIELALSRGPSEMYLLGFLGGTRLDQELANVLLLTRIPLRATLLDEHNECVLVRPREVEVWRPEHDEVVSLIPLETTDGVTTEGLRWPLSGDRLRVGDTRSISNEPVSDRVRVSIKAGVLLLTRHFPR